MASFIRAYKYALSPCYYSTENSPRSTALLRRPMLTQCATAAVLFGAGDVIAQQAFEMKGASHEVHTLKFEQSDSTNALICSMPGRRVCPFMVVSPAVACGNCRCIFKSALSGHFRANHDKVVPMVGRYQVQEPMEGNRS
jgi:hypothetical protein